MKQELFSHPGMKRAFERQIRNLWPALKGSLTKIHKPCIRKHCPACARGTKHPAWILTVCQSGRRRCLYVPETLVPTLQLAIRNGRKLEQSLARLGPDLLLAFRRQRDFPRHHRSAPSKS